MDEPKLDQTKGLKENRGVGGQRAVERDLEQIFMQVDRFNTFHPRNILD